MRTVLTRYRARLSGILHYWLPTVLVGTVLRVWRFVGGEKSINGGLPRSILVVRLDHIGDLVLSSAMFRELRRLYPQAHITVVTSSRTKDLLEPCPYVDEVIGKVTYPSSLRNVIRDLLITRKFCKRHLAGRRFDMSIIPRWDIDQYFATLICLYSNAVERVAFTEKCSPEKRVLNRGFDSFFTKILPPGSFKHEAERNLDVVRHLGGQVKDSRLALWFSASDKSYAQSCLKQFDVDSGDCLFAFGIGATKGQCRWPVASYAKLIDYLRGHLNFTPVIVCGPEDGALTQELARSTDMQLLIPDRPTLRQTAALLSSCTLFLGNNSGPLHMAAAVGLPVVEISCHAVGGDPLDQLNPERFGPFAPVFHVARPQQTKAPCRSVCQSTAPHCITEVTVEAVGAAALSLLQSKNVIGIA